MSATTVTGPLTRAVAIAAWLVAGAATSAAAQTPVRSVRNPGSAPAAGTGAISGTVTAESSGRPVRLASVVIIGAATGTLRVGATDAEGRFVFSLLPADRFVIGASKAPYIGTVAGARRPARPGAPIALADGQTISDVSIRLPMGAVITGTITDERGQPGANVLVAAERRQLQGGERVAMSVPGMPGVVRTDDQGRYRIYGLPPGDYVVIGYRPGGPIGQFMPRALTDAEVDRALRGGSAPVGASNTADPAVRYAPVFFPGTTRANDATPIMLAVGEERQSVDFRLELVRTVRVEGTVVASDGQPVVGVTISLATTGAIPLQSTMGVRAMPDGRFTFANITPGTYTLVARTIQMPPPNVGPPPPSVTGRGISAAGPVQGAPASSQFATASIEVGGVDQSGIQLTLRPPVTFSARLVFHGTTSPPALVGHRIPLRSLTAGLTGPAAPIVTATTPTGAFTVTNLSAGSYLLGGPLFFGATADSVTWSLESVVVDGRDVTDLPFDITSDAAPRDVTVTYGDRWQQVSGRLSQSSGAVASDYTIVVFPVDRAYWIPGSRRIVTTRPGTDGQFTLSGPGPATLPPGQYLLAAVTEIDRDEQFDPSLLATLVAGAVPITLRSGDTLVRDLVIK